MNILERIIERKREEVRRRKAARPDIVRQTAALSPTRDFAAALSLPGMSVISEIKRRSPSKGVIRENLIVARVARTYERAGARAISVLTDADFFGGSIEDLQAANVAVALPVLRKDFTIDDYQIHEARLIGADAVLLIARILGDIQLRDYLELARELGLAALVEVHDEVELMQTVDSGAEIIGVNSRDLDTFEVSLETTLRLIENMPQDCIAVAESGIHTRDDVRRLEEAGADAVLVGEALMRADDPGGKLAELLGATP